GHPLLDVDIRQGRTRALKLTDLSNHFRTKRHPDRRGNICDNLSRTPLMGCIAKTVEIRDRDGFDSFIAQLRDQSAHEGFVQRLQLAAVSSDTLGNVKAQMARYQRLRQVEIKLLYLLG